MRQAYYLLTFVGMIFFSISSYAQVTTSEIRGQLFDNQKPLAGATIKAIHTPSGTKYSTTSRQDGYYNIANARIGGPYTITVNYTGMKTEVKENIYLNLGQSTTINFDLATTTNEIEGVTVSANQTNKVFNKNRTGSQEVISRSQIERLPTISRSWQDFTKLTPSASVNSTNNGVSFGGRNASFNNVTVDGASFNNSFGLQPNLGSQTNSQPISIDAIEQIQVNISPYDVRDGGFTGAGINTITRSGTNTFKGSVYTYLKGKNTQGYKVEDTELPKQDFTYNLRGFSLGGPILKDKLFFFGNFEQERITQPGTVWQSSNATRSADANASISGANNETLDKLRSFLIEKYGYNPGNYEGYSYGTKSDKATVRLDWNVNETHSLTMKYNYFKSGKDIAASNSGAPGNNRQPSFSGLPFSGSGYVINNNFNIFIAELNSRFENASNKFQIGYSALRDYRESLSKADFPLVDILDPNGNSYTSFGFEPFTYNNRLNSDIFQFSNITTLYKGTHEITFGTQNFYKKFKNGFAPNYMGAYRFNSVDDFINSASNGVANSSKYQLQYSLTDEFPFAKIGTWELGLFAQDKWRVTNQFTLTYGLRVDAPIYDNKFQTNDVVNSLTFRDNQTIDVGQKPNVNLLFSPRIGFNWDIDEQSKTQLRGGIGIFAGAPPFVWISNQASNNGVQFGSFSSDNIPYAFNPDANAYKPTNLSANTSYNLVAINKGFKYPQVLKTTLAIDKELPGGIIATLEGMYAKDINAVHFENINLPSSNTTLSGVDNRLRFDKTKIYSGNTVQNPNISDAILMKNTNKGYSYNLTLQLQKNFKNLYVSAAYTNSRARSVNDGGSIAQSMWRDRYVSNDPNNQELGFANFHMPHRFIGAASYKIEYGKNYATSIGLIFEVAPSGIGSYTYNGDVNNDGSGTNNDLIYIPKNINDINLVNVNNGPATASNTTLDHSDIRTKEEIWNQLNSFIEQDNYMKNNRGKVMERNGAILPYFKKADLNITQDFHFLVGRKQSKQTLRLTLDLMNIGNLISSNWGIYKTFSNTSFLKFEGVDANNQPAFSFPYANAKDKTPLTTNVVNNSNLLSRWQMQFGIRYLFN